jgi:NADPH-dependent stearoyl-CoA 9-desaturase
MTTTRPRLTPWDTACPGDQWRHSHNYIHHTHTNVLGRDRDIGYGILRMSEDQPWRTRDLGNPIYATLLALLFQWGVAVHRNLWSFMIIFCGHFPDGVEEFSAEEVENETRGGWYVRQMLGSANLSGSKLFHILSGNLSHQIEHHLFPDIPAHRYAEIAVEVREICQRYGLPYNTGPLHRQFGSVVRKIFRLALPDTDPPPETATAAVTSLPVQGPEARLSMAA